MRALNLLEILRIVFFISCTAVPIVMHAQSTFTVLANFDGNDGGNPYAGLIQATDGNFYGTTGYGGASRACGTGGCGTIFKITAAGTLTTLHSFDVADGAYPARAALVQGAGGNFYGTTLGGGAYGKGTFFKITATGKLTTIYNFDDSYDRPVGLVQGTDGNFYGTTSDGGASSACGTSGCGTIFKISQEGKLTTVHSFDLMDGANPHAGLIQGTDGNFYGTTLQGGNSACYYGYGSGCGTVFKMTPAGQLTTLHSFDFTDGFEPNAPLVQARSGNFYGTTLGGGANFHCTTYTGCGTVFKITPAGQLTRIHSLEPTHVYGNFLSYFAVAGLVEGTDQNFYGTTYDGGNSEKCYSGFFPDGCGTVFKISPEGKLTTLYSFGSNNEAYPFDGLVQGTDGSFYGTTWVGGETNGLCQSGCGTVFSISVGLGPFVKTNPTFGKVGTKVTILGNNLAGATSVTFNGTMARFKASNTYITTTVPTGASTGAVEVVTPKKTLKSNVPFTVPEGLVGYSE